MINKLFSFPFNPHETSGAPTVSTEKMETYFSEVGKESDE